MSAMNSMTEIHIPIAIPTATGCGPSSSFLSRLTA